MEIEAYLFVYGMKHLYVIMKRSVVWCCLWPHLIPWGSLQGPSGEEYIKTLGLNTHMCSFHLKKCLCSLDPRITGLKKILTFSHLKFQNSGLNLHTQKCRQILKKQSQLEEMEEAGGIAKRSSVERDHTAARGHVKTFYMIFLSWGPLLLWAFLGKLVIEDELTYCWVLALLLQQFERRKRAALILVVIVVVDNLILIIM